MKRTIAWFAENHVAANLLMLFFLIAGVLTAVSIKLEVFPETSLDRIIITIEYYGASPAEVEESVIRQIEEKVAGLAGIKRIDSTAREGFGSVVIELVQGWELKKLLDEVKAEVDRITTLPEEAERPVVREVTRRVEVIDVAVYGDAPESTIKHLAETIRDDITNLPGITLAELSAVRNSEIHIEISERVLRRYGLTLGLVAEAIARSSLDLPAGSIKAKAGEILVRTKGRRYDAADYRDIPVLTRPDGTVVTLARMADITEGFQDVDIFARFQGKPAAIINVYRVADQNALAVAGSVKAYIEKVRSTLPAGVGIDYFADMAKILRSRLELLLNNMAIGLVLVILLLGMFLSMRLSFWVTLGIPISFAFGLVFLPPVDVSINMISLFAFIMILGIVVDDAIIVGENVYRKREEGHPPLQAAVEGTLEVGRPVIFSVLTTMVAFAPLLIAGGMMGKFMRSIPIVVILVLAGSLIECLLVLPAHLARSRGGTPPGPGQRERVMSRVLKWTIAHLYRRAVFFCVRWRYVTVAAGISLLLLTVGLWNAGWVKFTFFPKVEGDTLECLITMPVGTPAAETEKVVAHLEETAVALLAEQDRRRPPAAPPLLNHSIALIGAQIGQPGDGGEISGHIAQVWIQLLEGELRDVSAMKLMQMWRSQAGNIPEAEAIVFKSELQSMGNAIEIHLSLPEDERLQAAADDLQKELEAYSGVYDIADSFQPGKQEMQLTLNPDARSLGVKLDDLARQVRHALYGAEALRFQRGKDEVKVLVRYPGRERRSLTNVEDMRIRTRDGHEVPFKQVAEVRLRSGYANIHRAQRQRVIKITADVDEKTANANEIRNDLEKRYLPILQTKYPGLRFTMEGEGKEQKESLGDLYSGFAIALFAIYALLAIPFRSFTQPFVVMLAIPFGVVGAVIGHLVMGIDISFVSLFGIVGLSGVVVNDALVLIDRANRFRVEGADSPTAVLEAGALRFRAVILTSLTTFAGLTPMILEKSLQAKFLIPMAVSLGFGVLFATVITLILVPCSYVILDDLLRFLKSPAPDPST